MALQGDYHYLADGTVRLDLTDGSSTLMSGSGADAVVLTQTNPAGDVFSEFDHSNPPNPHHVQFHDGTAGDYHYQPDGTVELDLSDGSSTLMSGTGPDAHVLSQTTANGDVFTNFDAQGHPGHVVFHG